MNRIDGRLGRQPPAHPNLLFAQGERDRVRKLPACRKNVRALPENPHLALSLAQLAYFFDDWLHAFMGG